MAHVKLDASYPIAEKSEQRPLVPTGHLEKFASMKIVDVGNNIMSVFQNNRIYKIWFNIFSFTGLGYLGAELACPALLPIFPYNLLALLIGIVSIIVLGCMGKARLMPFMSVFFGFFLASLFIVMDIGSPRANMFITEYTEQSLKGHDFWIDTGWRSPGMSFTHTPTETTAESSTTRTVPSPVTWEFREGKFCLSDSPCMTLNAQTGRLIEPDGSVFGRIQSIWTVSDADKARNKLKI